jgi:hypothetical protein
MGVCVCVRERDPNGGGCPNMFEEGLGMVE